MKAEPNVHCTKSTNAKGEGKEMKADRGRDKRERCRGNFKRGAGCRVQVDRCKGNFKSGARGRGSCISFDSGSGNCCCCLRCLRLHVTSLAIGAFVNTPAPPPPLLLYLLYLFLLHTPALPAPRCLHIQLPLSAFCFACVFLQFFSPNFRIRIHACLLCVCVCVLVCARVCVYIASHLSALTASHCVSAIAAGVGVVCVLSFTCDSSRLQFQFYSQFLPLSPHPLSPLPVTCS